MFCSLVRVFHVWGKDGVVSISILETAVRNGKFPRKT